MTEAVSQAPTEAEIRHWLVSRLAERLQLPPDELDIDTPIIGFGLDSMQAVVLIGELEDWLSIRLAANPLTEFPTIQSLSRHLAERVA